MKIQKILEQQEERGIVKFYVYELEYIHGHGFKQENVIDYEDEDDMEVAITAAMDEVGIRVKPQQADQNVWYAWDIDSDSYRETEEADEDGRYMSYEIFGKAVVVARGQPIDDKHPVWGQMEEEMIPAAEEAMEEGREAEADARRYHRDPYAYHGVRRSDFM